MTKKLLIIVIILLIVYIVIPREKNIRTKTNKEDNEIRGVFISYLELNHYIKDKDITTSKEHINKMIDNIKKNNFNTIYLQVRSYMDTIYQSSLFPTSKSIILKDGSSYDVLDYFIKKATKKHINIYAWINPYRIGSSFDRNSAYYNEVKNDIKIVNNMYYLNPSSDNTTKLIIKGVEEVIQNYKVKGILFDDYFYPSDDIDIEEYNTINQDISIQQYHLNNINKMIFSVNKRIKQINKNILFGISPEGNIENNYNHNFADVKKWGSEEGYVDFLIPQIYYGFKNSAKPFEQVINEWENLMVNKNIELYAALAFYKTGTVDKFAKEGQNEWIENNDIIKRQVLSLRNHNRYHGFIVFRYDNLFNEDGIEEVSMIELENLKNIM